MRPIYLDNNATTALDPRVLDAMLPYFTEIYGNAASAGHGFGRAARQAVEASRESIARSLNAIPDEIIFTSGATESDNLAVKGVARALKKYGNHVITVETEHKAVLDSCHFLEREGFRVTYLGVDCQGLIDLDELSRSIEESTVLVSVMAANNEIGVIQEIPVIGAICRAKGVLFHSDATQAIGKIPFDVQAMSVDLASLTAHKIYGPKGAGGLYVRKEAQRRIVAQQDGGGHEFGLRSGTLNVPGIVGLARTLEICVTEMEFETERLLFLRERMKNGLMSELDGIHINGHPTRRLPGHLNLSFDDVHGSDLLVKMPEIAMSTTSACSSGAQSISHVLKALGIGDARAAGAVRIGIGRFNTEEEIDYTVGRMSDYVKRLRRLAI